jgi:hypothetical protein
VPAVLALGGLAVAAPRLAVSGTYAQFHGSFGTESLGGSALGKGMVLMGLVLALGVGWTGYWLARLNRGVAPTATTNANGNGNGNGNGKSASANANANASANANANANANL